MPRGKYRSLTLQQKVDLIKKSNGRSLQSLADEFEIGKSTAQNILKRKAEFLNEYETYAPAQKKRKTNCKFDQIDDFMWSWFQQVRAANVEISGPMVQERAMRYAESLGMSDFKASNGWLQKFRARHNITFGKVSGEGASTDPETVDEWKQRLPDIVAGYAQKDIFNMDESGLFYRALPDKTLRERSSHSSGGKKSKERVTAVFCVNQLGDFEKTMVIGRCEKPRCFKHKDTRLLPVVWKHNKRAWMTSVLFTDYMRKFNEKMKRQGRDVLMLLDNATCHPQLELSNVKMVFLPPNCTSHLQPLDQGIIQNIKTRYRKRILRKVVTAVEAGEDVSKISKCVNVFDACMWIAQATAEVKPATVQKCFLRCGIPSTAQHVSEDTDDDEDSVPLAQLMQRYRQKVGEESITTEDYVTCDDSEQVCDMDVAAMEERLQTEQQQHQQETDDDDDEGADTAQDYSKKDILSALTVIRESILRTGLADCLVSYRRIETAFEDSFLTELAQSDIRNFFGKL